MSIRKLEKKQKTNYTSKQMLKFLTQCLSTMFKKKKNIEDFFFFCVDAKRDLEGGIFTEANRFGRKCCSNCSVCCFAKAPDRKCKCECKMFDSTQLELKANTATPAIKLKANHRQMVVSHRQKEKTDKLLFIKKSRLFQSQFMNKYYKSALWGEGGGWGGLAAVETHE